MKLYILLVALLFHQTNSGLINESYLEKFFGVTEAPGGVGRDAKGMCSVSGFSHYKTFDGKRYTFRGKCSYYLLHNHVFTVVETKTDCRQNSPCTASVQVHINGSDIDLKPEINNVQISVNNQLFRQPYKDSLLTAYKASDVFFKFDFANGVEVMWDMKSRLHIWVPFKPVKTQGLCGSFDKNMNNEFLTRSGVIETSPEGFGASWKTQKPCQNSQVEPLPNCDNHVKIQAKQKCDSLKGDHFKECRKQIPVDGIYNNCVSDFCSSFQYCDTIAEYADECAAIGVLIGWIKPQNCRSLPCFPPLQQQVCGDSCEYSCEAVATIDHCESKCVEGCSCPAGQTMDRFPHCIPVANCSCSFNGKVYNAGDKVTMGKDSCTCQSAKWRCVAVSDNSTESACGENEEYTDCKPVCFQTCDSLDQAPPTCSQIRCAAGCRCKPGYVVDGQRCVTPLNCTCQVRGHRYHEGETYYGHCKECVCTRGQLQCNNTECPSICSVFGNSRYKTFDDKRFDFQGNCSYLLSESVGNATDKFQITVQNRVCGTTGTTCLASLTISAGDKGAGDYEELRLVKGRPVQPRSGGKIEVRTAGMFTLVTVEKGITLEWDNGTRVYLHLTSEHENKVIGLCGNFNGDISDELTTSPGNVTSTVLSFVEAMERKGTCAPPRESVDSCSNSQRKHWAENTCAVLGSSLFSVCHNVIPLDPYLSWCIQEGCACDLGGDTECVCAAIAAYASECATTSGTQIEWRSEDLCPIQCPANEEYEPCIIPCEKRTCDNKENYKNLTAACKKYPCVEGCSPQKCPRGQILDGHEESMQCIPESFCEKPKCLIGKMTFYQGDEITDKSLCKTFCEKCFCNKQEVLRFGSCPESTTHSPATSDFITTDNIAARSTSTDPEVTATSRALGLTGDSAGTVSADGLTVEASSDIGVSPVELYSPTYGSRPGESSSLHPSATGQQLGSASRVTDFNVSSGSTPEVNSHEPPTDSPQNGTSLPAGSSTSDKGTTKPLISWNVTSKCGKSQWLPWLNRGRPNPGDGDREMMTKSELKKFCDGGSVTNIECNMVSDNTPLSSSGIMGVCNLTTGLVCLNKDNRPFDCEDFKVRYYCNCTGAELVGPSSCTHSKWSGWINDHSPMLSDGDHEAMSIEDQIAFCGKGRIAEVECRVAGEKTPYNRTGQIVTCDPGSGLVCRNAENWTAKCRDYEIRYFCECAHARSNVPRIAD